MSIKEKMQARPAHPVIEEDNDNRPKGMKWHNFLVKFGLIAASVCNVLMGILQITGLRYTLNSYAGNTIMIMDEMYFYYPPVRIVDTVYWFTLFAVAVYQIIIRNMLKKGRKHSVRHLNIMIGIMCGISAFYDSMFSAFVRNEAFVRATISYNSASITLGTAVIAGIGLCVWNWYYYKERPQIFLKK